VEGDFVADVNSCLRPGDSTQGIGGTMFYFEGNHTLQVTGNSGLLQRRRSGSIVFDCQSASYAVQSSTIQCPSGTYSNLPQGVTTLTGNVLLAPCSGQYGDPLQQGARGILFFQDRNSQLPTNDQPMWNSAGSFALIGNIYFHQCHLGGAGDSGASCDTGAFGNTLMIGNGAAQQGYIVGDIVADQLQIGGGSNLTVMLNPNPQY